MLSHYIDSYLNQVAWQFSIFVWVFFVLSAELVLVSDCVLLWSWSWFRVLHLPFTLQAILVDLLKLIKPHLLQPQNGGNNLNIPTVMILNKV